MAELCSQIMITLEMHHVLTLVTSIEYRACTLSGKEGSCGQRNQIKSLPLAGKRLRQTTQVYLFDLVESARH